MHESNISLYRNYCRGLAEGELTPAEELIRSLERSRENSDYYRDNCKLVSFLH